jgi:hypothetical protein
MLIFIRINFSQQRSPVALIVFKYNKKGVPLQPQIANVHFPPINLSSGSLEDQAGLEQPETKPMVLFFLPKITQTTQIPLPHKPTTSKLPKQLNILNILNILNT